MPPSSNLQEVAAKSSRSPGDAGEPRSIVVRTPNWLGDLMMGTAFIRALLERFENVPVDLIVRKGFEGLPLPRRGAIIPYDKKSQSAGSFGAALRKRGYSHFFVMPPSFSSAWMAYRSRVGQRIGYRGQGRGWLLRPALRHRQTPRTIHLAREYLELLTPWTGQLPEDRVPGLEIDPAWVRQNLPLPLAEAAPYIVLAPGAEYGPAKQWPVAHYRELARLLASDGKRIVVMGLPGERPLGEEILDGIPTGLNLCGETTLAGLVAALANSALLISNDSGAMHVAAAAGIPQVALFGSTNPTWTAPLNPEAEVLYRAEPCSPCYGRHCRLGDTRCLQQILPEEVARCAIQRLRE